MDNLVVRLKRSSVGKSGSESLPTHQWHQGYKTHYSTFINEFSNPRCAPRVYSHSDHFSATSCGGTLGISLRDAHLTEAASAPGGNPSCLSAAASRSPRWSSGSLSPPLICNIQPSSKLPTVSPCSQRQKCWRRFSASLVAWVPLHKLRWERSRRILKG